MRSPHQAKKNLLLNLLVPLVGVAVGLLFSGCKRQTKEEKAKEELGEAIEAVGEALEEAAKK